MKYIKTVLLVFIFCHNLVQGQDGTKVSFRISIDENKFALKKVSSYYVSGSSDTVINNLVASKEGFSMAQSFPYSKYPQLLKLYTVNCLAKDTFNIVNRLKKAKSVSSIRKIYVPEIMYEPSDWYYRVHRQDECWYLDKIQAPAAWDITKGNDNATLAIIDSRFDYEHPDLKNKFIVDYDPYTGIKHTQIQAGGSNNDGHGTNVASLAVAQTDGGGLLASVGFNAKFYGYTWAMGLEKAHHASFELGVDVISISWFYEGLGYAPEDALVIKEIIDNGTIIVAAAGNGPGQSNGGETCPFCPLNDSRIIKVTSSGIDDKHTFFDSQGVNHTHSHYPGVDICAPGYYIPSATPSGGTTFPYYGFGRGTSLATPIVAATCILMRDVNRCISPEQVENVLKTTADPILDANLYPGLVGAGRLNVYKAILGAIDEGTNHVDNLTLTNTQDFTGLYVASENTKINNGANITFTYDKDVTLESGFEVAVGGQFTTQQVTYVCE